MTADKIRRMNRLFRADGKALIVAMDHLAYFGPMPGLERPAGTIRKVVAGGADVIMTTFGIATTFAAEIGQAGLILRADGGTSRLATAPAAGSLLYRAEDALRIGADGVACMGFPGSSFEHLNLPHLAELAAQCHEWRLPLLAEMLPQGFENPKEAWTPENIRTAVRIGAELGADIIKTRYTGSVESFRPVIESCPVPVVVLGGPKMETDEDLLRTVREAMDAGASGVAMGRNIWQHAQPDCMTAAVAAIIHEGASVEEALQLL